MNELTPIGTDYQAVRAKIEGTILPKLAEFEEYSLAQLSKHVADEMRGIHVKNTANLMSLFTSDLYEDCVSAYGADASSDDFVDFCLQELNDKIAFMSLVAWPVAYDREGAWSALSFHMPQWADKVSIIGEHASSNIGDVI